MFKSLSLSLTINGFVDVTLSYVNTKYVCMRTIVEYFLLTLVDLAPCGGLLYRHGLHALVPIHRIHSWRLWRLFVDFVLYAAAEDASALTVWRFNHLESHGEKMASKFVLLFINSWNYTGSLLTNYLQFSLSAFPYQQEDNG